MSSFNLAASAKTLSRRSRATCGWWARDVSERAHDRGRFKCCLLPMPSSYLTGSIEVFADLAIGRSRMLSPRSAIEFGRSGRIVYREVSTRVVPAIDTRD